VKTVDDIDCPVLVLAYVGGVAGFTQVLVFGIEL
jgi:hypothetical protein